MGRSRLVRLLWDDFLQTTHALVNLQRAAQQVIHEGRKGLFRFAILEQTDVVAIEPELLGGIMVGQLTRKYGFANHQPCHHGRQPERNARHFAGVGNAVLRRNFLVIIFAKQLEIFLSIHQKLHGLIKNAGHQQNVAIFGVRNHVADMCRMFLCCSHGFIITDNRLPLC